MPKSPRKRRKHAANTTTVELCTRYGKLVASAGLLQEDGAAIT